MGDDAKRSIECGSMYEEKIARACPALCSPGDFGVAELIDAMFWYCWYPPILSYVFTSAVSSRRLGAPVHSYQPFNNTSNFNRGSQRISHANKKQGEESIVLNPSSSI